jgi:hypothetical protein
MALRATETDGTHPGRHAGRPDPFSVTSSEAGVDEILGGEYSLGSSLEKLMTLPVVHQPPKRPVGRRGGIFADPRRVFGDDG